MGASAWVRRRADRLRWTPPTSTELATIGKSGLAAGVAWWVSTLVTDVPDPVLAALTALVVVQVSVRASLLTALQRSVAVVLGVLLALAIGDALGLNGFTVGVLVAAALAVAELVLRLPAPAAVQVPVSGLVVLAAVSADPASLGFRRALDTVIGAAIGVVVSLTLPASRLVDARQTLDRLGTSLGDVLDAMGTGLQGPWSAEQSAEWRRRAHAIRDRLVKQAAEAVGNGRETAKWNVRDRRHIDTLGRFESAMPRFERTAIGVSAISRGLDDQARLAATSHARMRAMGELLIALGGTVRAIVRQVVDDPAGDDVQRAFDEVARRREPCARAAARRARVALDQDVPFDPEQIEGEWLDYAALLVQVDRIVADLAAPLST